MTTTNSQVREILKQAFLNYDYRLREAKVRAGLQQPAPSPLRIEKDVIKEAEQAINALIDEKVVAARIDELGRLPDTKHISYVDERISQLSKRSSDE